MPPTEDTEVTTEVTEETTLVAPTPEDTADDTTEVTGEVNDDTDPFEVAYEARRELERSREREQMEREIAERLRKEAIDAANAARAAAEADKVQETFADVIKAARTGLGKINVKAEDGEELTVGITDEAFEEAVAKPLQRFNAAAEQTYTQRVYNELATAASTVLPTELHEEFNKQATGKDLPGWIRTLVEVNAPHSEFAKRLTEDKTVAEKAAEARGYARGQKARVGVPKVGEERFARDTSPTNSWSGASAALARGDITEGEFRDIVKKLRSST